MISLLSLKALG